MRIGRHMPTGSKPVKAAQLAHEIGCEAIQIFASNPTGWQPPTRNDEADRAFAQAAQAYQLDPVVIHAPYLINLASPDDINWKKSINLLTWTMQRSEILGVKYVVFHTGSHRGAGVEAGIARLVEGVRRVLRESPTGVMLLLENDVGAGASLGHSFEQLAQALAQLEDYKQQVGVCIDTAHLWGGGHDISTREAALQVIQHCSETIGLERVKVLHLNGTAKALASHRDVHTRLGEGIIGTAGIKTIMRHPGLSHAVGILETPIKTISEEKEDWLHDAGQMAQARALRGTLTHQDEASGTKPIALITGGSRGIGAQTALVLAEFGFDVALTYRNKAGRANEISEQIQSQQQRALALPCDMTRPDDVEAFFQALKQWSNHLDLLVLNASGGMEKDLTAADPEYAMHINRDAQLRWVNAALPFLNDGSTLVFITSHWAHLYGQMEQIPAYEPVARSKYAGEQALRARLPEFTERGIRLLIVTGDLIEGTITPKLLERSAPGLLENRKSTTGMLPTAAEMGREIAIAAINPALTSGSLVVVGEDLQTMLKQADS